MDADHDMKMKVIADLTETNRRLKQRVRNLQRKLTIARRYIIIDLDDPYLGRVYEADDALTEMDNIGPKFGEYNHTKG
jgi:hypothetical protein